MTDDCDTVIHPENGGWEREVRSDTMDAVRSCEFFGLPATAAADELEFLAERLRDGGYDILGGDLDV